MTEISILATRDAKREKRRDDQDQDRSWDAGVGDSTWDSYEIFVVGKQNFRAFAFQVLKILP